MVTEIILSSQIPKPTKRGSSVLHNYQPSLCSGVAKNIREPARQTAARFAAKILFINIHKSRSYQLDCLSKLFETFPIAKISNSPAF